MAKEEKDKISHRGIALALVKSHFSEAGYVFDTLDRILILLVYTTLNC